jgi:Zinc carboxypeptidase
VPYPSKVSDIDSRISALATNFPTICTRLEGTNKTWEGSRTVAFLRIGTGTGGGRPRILIVAGLHARELAPPDAVLTFVEKLLTAFTQQVPLVYDKFLDTRGGANILYKKFTIPFLPDVQQIVEKTELYVMPLANPDGRAFVQSPTGFKMWRKNRRPAPPGLAPCPALPPMSPADSQFVSNDPTGVDLNRNFDVAWDFKKYYSNSFFSAIAQLSPPQTLGVSDDPCDFRQLFHGPAASPRVREPETQNIVDIVTNNKINFYMDVHSDAGQILFPWGIAGNQETSPDQSFKNTALDNPALPGRDPTASTAYKEWVPPGVTDQHRKLGELIRDKIKDSTGYTAADEGSTNAATANLAKTARQRSLYPAVQSVNSFLIPDLEPGGSDDFAFSQQIGANPGPPITATALDSVFSFTFECGRPEDGGFQPLANTEYPKVEREVGMCLATYLSFAATWKAPVSAPPPGPSANPLPGSTNTPSSKSDRCACRVAVWGSPLQPVFQFVCDLRDQEIKQTQLGGRYMRLAERLYYRFSPRLAEHLMRHPLAKSLTRWTVVAPALHLIVACSALLADLQPRERRVRWLLASITGAALAVSIAALVPLVLLAKAVATR